MSFASSGASKSQLYSHFPGQDDLVHAVIALRGQQVMEREARGWSSSVVQWPGPLAQSAGERHFPAAWSLRVRTGSMTNELTGQYEQAMASLAGYFATWDELRCHRTSAL